ncbi:hypothetical protein [Azotobacter beijerinckii]|uniref:hypothetical protein n=1 Tax=Azotobacter beijerinckii TaxID=170623 RepID=UPI0029530D22|nr:hypothetical protein [Azotobacter beijerinckii]MDV7213273.1 hypothetical protein [Azotobacter beijerinckii]
MTQALGHEKAIGVRACNRKRPGSQSTLFPAQINCAFGLTLVANELALSRTGLHSISAGSRFLQLNITAPAVQKTKVYWTLASRLAETE